MNTGSGLAAIVSPLAAGLVTDGAPSLRPSDRRMPLSWPLRRAQRRFSG